MACVEHLRAGCLCHGGAQGDYVLVGNTSEPDRPANKFTRAEWREFLAGAKLGEFDDFA